MMFGRVTIFVNIYGDGGFDSGSAFADKIADAGHPVEGNGGFGSRWDVNVVYHDQRNARQAYKFVRWVIKNYYKEIESVEVLRVHHISAPLMSGAADHEMHCCEMKETFIPVLIEGE
jgi:hypothetical protein